MKIRVKVGYSNLTLSKNPPPLSQILATRLVTDGVRRVHLSSFVIFWQKIAILALFGTHFVPRF